MKGQRKPAAPTPKPSPVHPSPFTIDERDAIDRARTRLRGYITLLDSVVSDDMHDEPDVTEALDVLITDMRAAINAIDETFQAADERAQGGAR